MRARGQCAVDLEVLVRARVHAPLDLALVAQLLLQALLLTLSRFVPRCTIDRDLG